MTLLTGETQILIVEIPIFAQKTNIIRLFRYLIRQLDTFQELLLEAKACKQLSLSQWMDEVRVQKKNAGAQVGAAVVKRRNHQAGRAYVVMEFDDFLDLIR